MIHPIDVVRTFIRSRIAGRGERDGLKLLERVAEIEADTAAPHRVRWPQILADVHGKREALGRLLRSRSGSRRRPDRISSTAEVGFAEVQDHG